MPRWSAACLLLTLIPHAGNRLEAHPSEAPPIENAHVFAFESGYSEDDPDEHLEAGGKLLISELNCVACHKVPTEVSAELVPAPGPDLNGIGSRLGYRDIWIMVRNPHFLRKGSPMPSLFSHVEDRETDAVTAIAKYLHTRKSTKTPEYPEGDSDRGRMLYHQVGCVACHHPATEADYKPPNTRPGFPVDKPGIASIPIRLADLYKREALIEFLLKPNKFHPAGRMPSMGLTEGEAADLAAYLQIEGIQLEEEKPDTTAEELARGKRYFGELNCAACHKLDDEEIPPPPLSRPLLDLDIAEAKGCLSLEPSSGAPFFRLSELQRKAITLALTDFKKPDREDTPEDSQRVNLLFAAYNCYACHERDGKGGPEIPRAQYFDVKNEVPEIHKEFATLPPSLTGVGHKLKPDWLRKILAEGDGHVRPLMHTRMPHFGKENMAELISLLPKADTPASPTTLETALPEAKDADRGRDLFFHKDSGVACSTCHGLGETEPTGDLPSINLIQTTERLTPSYFKTLLLRPEETIPGSAMPAAFEGRKNADLEIEQIWNYLESMNRRAKP